jgi:uncharacterized protein (DUF302 family)
MRRYLSQIGVALCFTLLGASVGAKASVCTPTLAPRADGAQVSDTEFIPDVLAKTYRDGEGPVVYLDEAHHNFHTIEGRYATFAKVLRMDGFSISPFRKTFDAESLGRVEILVIANAQATGDDEAEDALPTHSAFSADEIVAIEQWVSRGGSLFLIADHMPWPGAAENLGRALGVQMTNSFATDKSCSDDEFLFERDNGSLGHHQITDGRSDSERIDHVRTFTGQAFWLTEPGVPILRLKPGSVLLLPSQAWQLHSDTPQVPGDGLLQGAVLEHGKGRIAVFGEAAMFSAQVSGPKKRPMGMNMPSADQNAKFLLNIMHWLARQTPKENPGETTGTCTVDCRQFLEIPALTHARTTTLPSKHGVSVTIDRLASLARSKGLEIFARVDHAKNAQDVDMVLRPTQLLLFGSPRVGTRLMQDQQITGIDLPLRALAWEDSEGHTWISYYSGSAIAARHGLGEASRAVAEAIDKSMAMLCAEAAGDDAPLPTTD